MPTARAALAVVAVLGSLTVVSCGNATKTFVANTTGTPSTSVLAVPTTVPAPRCLSCPPAQTLPPTTINEEERTYALRVLATDPVLTPVVGHWHVLLLQSSAPWVFVDHGLDFPATFTWTQTEEGCIDGHGQPALYSFHAPDLTELLVKVNLAGEPTIYLPGPPKDLARPPAVTRTLMRVLGPPTGPCPSANPSD